MAEIGKKFRLALACAGLVSLLALPGAAFGVQGCSCDGCRSTPAGCFESDQCHNGICNWNGPACNDNCRLTD